VPSSLNLVPALAYAVAVFAVVVALSRRRRPLKIAVIYGILAVALSGCAYFMALVAELGWCSWQRGEPCID
jgi:hypothetical protein